jgi:biotin carboxyl carrier protein
VGVTIGAARVQVGVRRALPIASRRPAGAVGAERVEVRAHMPGLIVAVPVEIGSAIRPGEPVAIVEAMKMQMEVPSPVPGCLAEIRVRPGQEVAGGQVLVVVLPEEKALSAETRS